MLKYVLELSSQVSTVAQNRDQMLRESLDCFWFVIRPNSQPWKLVKPLNVQLYNSYFSTHGQNVAVHIMKYSMLLVSFSLLIFQRVEMVLDSFVFFTSNLPPFHPYLPSWSSVCYFMKITCDVTYASKLYLSQGNSKQHEAWQILRADAQSTGCITHDCTVWVWNIKEIRLFYRRLQNN